MEDTLSDVIRMARAIESTAAPAGERFGARVRRLRTIQRLSLDDLATKTGVTRGYLWKLEAGRAGNPGLLQIHKIAPALGVSPGYLAEAAP